MMNKEPEQEPVAWRTALERIADPRNTHFGNDARVVAKSALDTTPPRRKPWAPLTDEQIKDGYNDVEWTHAPAAHWFEAGVKFSEAKLKEKNYERTI